MDKPNNTPPPWSEAPPWAMWRAQDSDGEWVWYHDEPIIDSSGNNWYARLPWDVVVERPKIPSRNWKQTKEKRPENE